MSGDGQDIAFDAPPLWREIAGYRICRDTDGRWEVTARGIGVVHQGSLPGALIAHTRAAGVPWYLVPGYGRVYRTTQMWLHRHGFCVLHCPRLSLDSSWRCSWCGNRASPPP